MASKKVVRGSCLVSRVDNCNRFPRDEEFNLSAPGVDVNLFKEQLIGTDFECQPDWL